MGKVLEATKAEVRNYDPGPLARSEKFQEALKAFVEIHAQAPHDLCGKHREWYLLRLQSMFYVLSELFPAHMGRAFEMAKDPYGNKLM